VTVDNTGRVSLY